jgi:hypothetical protein
LKLTIIPSIWALLPEAQFSAVLRTLKERYDRLSADQSFAHERTEEPGKRCRRSVGTFALRLGRNVGNTATGLKMDARSVSYRKFGKCVFCKMLQEELDSQHRGCWSANTLQ